MEKPERSWHVQPNSATARYEPPDPPVEPSAERGFHTYATSELYDTDGGGERWPDNWPGPHTASTGPPNRPRPPYPDDEDEEPSNGRNYLAALIWTGGWYAVPLLILVGRALALPAVDPVCATTGLSGCVAPRTAALADLTANAPLWGLALAGGLLLAAVLRWASDTWRPVTIGFCAAVVSGGAATVLHSIL